MADSLSLLFELDADGRPAVAEFQRVRKAFAGELDALRKSVARSFTLPPIKLPTASTGRAGGSQADAHVKEFKRIEAEAAKSAKAQEREQQRLNRAVQSLQRQRSAALIRAFKDEERAAVASARAQERAAQQAAQAVQRAFKGIGPGLQSLGRTLTVGVTAPLLALGAGAIKSAKDLDANVNTLKAFTGSAEAAERRLAQLIKTARGTPGLTTNLALTLDAQLRVAKTTQETIDRVLPAIGRLNAVSKLPDPTRFVDNLKQLVTQNFERQDLKELVGQSPLAGQLITEIFNVDSPTNAKAIRDQAKKLGLTTVDAFFNAFADAAAKNQGLASVTESIGTQFEKLRDRVTVALRPLGLAIANALGPIVEAIVPIIEKLGSAFASLPSQIRATIVVAGALAAALGPLLFLVGSLIQSIGQLIPALVTLNAIGLLPTLTNLRLIGQVMVGTASLAAGATATAVVAAAGWAALAVAVAAGFALVGTAIYRHITAEKELAKVSAEQIKATSAEIKSLREQLTFVNGLKGGVASTAVEQERLRKVYASLNPESRARVESIKDEAGRLRELGTELQRLLKLRTEEQRIQAATLGANLEQAVKQAEDAEAAVDRLTDRINALSRARDTIEKTGSLSRQQIEDLGFPDLLGTVGEQQLPVLAKNIELLAKVQGDLRKEADKLNSTAREQSEALKSLAEQSGVSERSILAQARNMGLLKTTVDAALKSITEFRERQEEAAKDTKSNTKEIDEQTKSLKELKRALNEAELATRERSAATKRAFDEDKISSQEATRRLINDARQLAAAQTKDIDATLEAKRKELEGADAEEAEKLRDQIGDLELQRTQILSQTAIEVEDLRAEQRRRERDGEAEHQTSLIQRRRTSSQKQIDDLRDRMEREESFRLEGERKIVSIEQDITKAEEDEIRRRLNLVAEGTDARKALEDELDNFLKEKARQRAEQARRIAQAELDKALLPVRRQGLQEGAAAAGDAGVTARLRSVADEGLASFETTERQIGKIIDDAFARRIKRLQDGISIRKQHNRDVSELNAELRTLEQERTNASEETDRAIEQARQADLGRAQSYRDRLASIYAGVAEIAFELRGRVIDALRRGLAPERQIIEKENELAVAREQLRHSQVAADVHANIDRLEALQKRRQLNAQELLELKAHREALQKEADLNRSNQAEIERQRKIGLERANPNSTRSLFGDTFADAAEAIRAAAAAANVAISNLTITLGSFGAAAAEHFANASAQAGNFISVLLNGIDQINAGLGDMLANWILTGDVGSQALRKLLASTLAYYSRTFLIKALDNIGEGFSNLAKASAAAASGNFASAALFKAAAVQNFLSATKYGLASAATAVAGRFAAPDSKQKDTAGRAISGGRGADPEPRNQQFNLGGQGPVESSSRAAREGSGGPVADALNRQTDALNLHTAATLQLNATISRWETRPEGVVFANGAEQRPDAVGVAFMRNSQANHDLNEYMQRIASGQS